MKTTWKSLLLLIVSLVGSFSACAPMAYEFPPNSVVLGLSGYAPQERTHFKISYEDGSFFVEHRGKKQELQDCFVEAVLRQINPQDFSLFVHRDNKLKLIRAHDGGYGLLGELRGGVVGVLAVVWGTVITAEVTTAALVYGGLYVYKKLTKEKDPKCKGDLLRYADDYDRMYPGGYNGRYDVGCGPPTQQHPLCNGYYGGPEGIRPGDYKGPPLNGEEFPEHLVKTEDLVHRKGGSFWQGLKPHKGKTRTNGLSGGKRRYYELDRLQVGEGGHHGEVEGYNGQGKHVGAFDSETGNQIKPADPSRSIKV